MGCAKAAVCSAEWASSSVCSNPSAGCSHANGQGLRPMAWSSVCNTEVPQRRTTPARGKRSNCPQVVMPRRTHTGHCAARSGKASRGKRLRLARDCQAAGLAGTASPPPCGDSNTRARAAQGLGPRARRTSDGPCTFEHPACSLRSKPGNPPHKRRLRVTSSTHTPCSLATSGVNDCAHAPSHASSAVSGLCKPIQQAGKLDMGMLLCMGLGTRTGVVACRFMGGHLGLHGC